MVKKHLIICSLSIAAIPLTLKAGDNPTHVIITGMTGQQQLFDLSVHNRISFDNQSMRLSSPGNPDLKDVDLPYLHFNHIEFANRDFSGLEESITHSAELIYSSIEKSIILITDLPDEFTLQVYNSLGILVTQSKIKTGESVDVKMLPIGFYIAIADNNNNQIKTKFIIR